MELLSNGNVSYAVSYHQHTFFFSNLQLSILVTARFKQSKKVFDEIINKGNHIITKRNKLFLIPEYD